MVIRHGKSVIKSTVQSATLSPRWANLSAVLYHKKLDAVVASGKVSTIAVEVWHRSLLMDYFVGLVELAPFPEKFRSSEVKKNEEDGDEMEIFEEELRDRKGRHHQLGKLLYQISTSEDLRRF